MKTKRLRRRFELKKIERHPYFEWSLLLLKPEQRRSNDPVQIALVDRIRLCCSVKRRKIEAKYFPCFDIISA